MTVSKQNVHETRPQDLAFTFLKSQDLNLSKFLLPIAKTFYWQFI